MQAIFPNMCKVLKLLAVTPVTTCSRERSISSLRTLKSYMKSTMGQVLICFFLQFHCIWWGNKQLVYIHYAYLCRIWFRRVPPPHSSMIVAVLVLVIKWIKTKSFFICFFVLQWTLQVVIWQKRIAHLILDNFGHLLMIWIGVVEDGNK